MDWPSVCASSVILCASCAPLAEMRPAGPMMPGRSYELGTAAVWLGPRPYVEESVSRSGQLWLSADASRRVTFTGVSAFDRNAVAFGVATRFHVVRADRFAFSPELALGYAYGGFLLPVAVRVVDHTWIYTSPRLGTFGRDLSFGAPVGLSVRIWDGLFLRGEAQVSWPDFKYYNRRVHLAFGVAAQW